MLAGIALTLTAAALVYYGERDERKEAELELLLCSTLSTQVRDEVLSLAEYLKTRCPASLLADLSTAR